MRLSQPDKINEISNWLSQVRRPVSLIHVIHRNWRLVCSKRQSLPICLKPKIDAWVYVTPSIRNWQRASSQNHMASNITRYSRSLEYAAHDITDTISSFIGDGILATLCIFCSRSFSSLHSVTLIWHASRPSISFQNRSPRQQFNHCRLSKSLPLQALIPNVRLKSSGAIFSHHKVTGIGILLFLPAMVVEACYKDNSRIVYAYPQPPLNPN